MGVIKDGNSEKGALDINPEGQVFIQSQVHFSSHPRG